MILGIIYLIVAEKLAEWIKMGYGLYEFYNPFLSYEGKWVILLALTSNKGSHDFQLTEDTNGERLFEKVLRKSQAVSYTHLIASLPTNKIGRWTK